MRKISFIVFAPFLLITLCSERPSNPKVNENFWACYLNDSLLIRGNALKGDSVINLETAKIKPNDLIIFNYHFDTENIDAKYLTQTFISCSDKIRILVSKETFSNVHAHFRATRLREISDSTHCNILKLECKFNDMDVPWVICQFKI